MFGTILDQVSKLLGQGYLVSALTPWLIFWMANGVTFALVIGPRSLARVWEGEVAKSASSMSVLGLLGLLFLVLGAMLVTSLNGVFGRLLAGRYLVPPIGLFLRVARWYRTRQADRLRAKGEAALAEFGRATAEAEQVKAVPNAPAEQVAPADRRAGNALARLIEAQREMADASLATRIGVFRIEEVRPTRYGQAIDSVEAYAADRYGIESVVFWTRLQKVIPKEYFANVQDGKTLLDFLTALTVFAGVYTVAWFLLLPYLVARAAIVWWVALGGALATVVLYQASVEAAYSFGELMRACFDLFRHKLLKEFSLARPDTLAAEKDLWIRLSRFIVYGQPPVPDFTFGEPPAAPPENDDAVME